MRLDKPLRTKLRKASAKRQSLTFTWPEEAPEPVPGRKYIVNGLDDDQRLLVEARTETNAGWEVKARIDSDPIRGLRISARKPPEAQPMGGPQFRAETEPEQVDSRYQRLLDSEGRMKTAMQGNLHRKQQEVFRRERELADKRKKGKGGRLLEAQIERQKRHLKRAA